MLTIRFEQMIALASQLESARVSKLVDLIRPRWADTWDDEALAIARTRISGGLVRARGYGLTWELTLADFVIMDLTYGADFDQEPQVAEALRNVVNNLQPDVAFFSLPCSVPPETWNRLRSSGKLIAEG